MNYHVTEHMCVRMNSFSIPLRAALKCAVLAAVVSHPAMATTTVHVSFDGDDSHFGTRDQPVATVNRALAMVAVREDRLCGHARHPTSTCLRSRWQETLDLPSRRR
jgi:hypothetical protein